MFTGGKCSHCLGSVLEDGDGTQEFFHHEAQGKKILGGD